LEADSASRSEKEISSM